MSIFIQACPNGECMCALTHSNKFDPNTITHASDQFRQARKSINKFGFDGGGGGRNLTKCIAHVYPTATHV